MKNFNKYLSGLAIIALLFTSCSKDENNMTDDADKNLSSLSFGAVLNDFVSKRAELKAHLSDVPSCSDGVPAYVQVALKNGDTWVAGQNGDEGGFIQIPIAGSGDYNDDGVVSWFTKESSDLELTAGTYSLEYFGVLDSEMNVLWIAPRENDDYGPANFQNFVDDALPISIDLRSGVKKYVDVEVICYDERFADEYGYLFFDFNTVDVITFCTFGNYCNESGRHFPAHFNINAWKYSGDPESPKGESLISEAQMNEVGIYDNNDAYAKPVCIALPDRKGVVDEYYIEITLLDFNNVYDADEGVIRQFVVTDAEVLALYNQESGNNTYYHFREGSLCGEDTPMFDSTGGGNGGECDLQDDDADCDNDGILNGDDNCPSNSNSNQADLDGDNIGDICDLDIDGDGVANDEDNCPATLRLDGQVAVEGQLGCWRDPVVVGCTSSDCELTTDTSGLCYNVSVDLEDSSIIYKISSETDLELLGSKGDLNPSVLFGTANVKINGSDVVVTLDTPLDTDKIKGYKVKVWQSDENSTERLPDCYHTLCANDIVPSNGDQAAIPLTFSNANYSYPVYITIDAVICEDVPGPQ
ncbi:Thrombospondin type 3 repeat-containing protein [Gillisia sp. Hel1_33_143]|uniref:thrombospondin type 3 repeat-containing protein n=1 Tax=Gillisia sp. Hel1_33_143 TaxID=1336796 RepID=UPI00087C0478|nr:thrombospondin type 3 repeat-containing protein [Gillisia sp. Hel1_33_143]SDS81143.1 Thrombospondin type 3 repeat-containing protein [Gillisia sp. Hel1_33_143]